MSLLIASFAPDPGDRQAHPVYTAKSDLRLSFNLFKHGNACEAFY
jgi:hypothetical protein